MTRFILPALAVLTFACGDKTTVEGDSQASGQATYRDARTEPDGTEMSPASPEPQDAGSPMWVEVYVEGTPDLDLSGGGCEGGGLGDSFEVLYSGEAEVDDSGAYTAGFVAAEAEVLGAPECTVPDLSISVVTGVTVEGQLEATTQNCTSYCEAYGRAEAESACEGDSDEASCRSEAEAEASGSCQTTCEEGDTWAIVARTSLGASQVADVSASMVAGEGLVDLEVDLEFEMLVDEDGDEVSPQ